jgi:hypothetical protein
MEITPATVTPSRTPGPERVSYLHSHCRGEFLLKPFTGYVMNEPVVDLGSPFCISRSSYALLC